MSLQDFPDWLTELEAEDFEFLRLFVLTSGSLKEMETQIIRHLLDRLSADEVCARLGISRVTLWRKMKQYDIDASQFKRKHQA